MPRHLAASCGLILTAALAGCTQISIPGSVTIETTAIGCDVSRSQSADAGGAASGDVVTRALDGSLSRLSALQSDVRCSPVAAAIAPGLAPEPADCTALASARAFLGLPPGLCHVDAELRAAAVAYLARPDVQRDVADVTGAPAPEPAGLSDEALLAQLALVI